MTIKGFSGYTNESPFILLYEGTGKGLLWGKILKMSKYRFNGVAFSSNGLQIVTHTYTYGTNYDDYFIIFESLSGRLIVARSYIESSSVYIAASRNILLDASSTAYLFTMKGECSLSCTYRFMKIPLQDPTSVKVTESIKNTWDKPLGLTFGETDQIIYTFSQ